MFSYLKAIVDLYVPTTEETEELEGQGMVEYALILALVSIVAIAALLLLGPQIASIFTDITNELSGAGS